MLLVLLLFGSVSSSCTQDPVTHTDSPPATTTEQQSSLVDLKFDRRYLDSIAAGPPYSERTRREMAIEDQLRRLELYKRSLKATNLDGTPIGDKGESVTELVRDKYTTFPNHAAQLADIYRKMDSLKVLEKIPLTSYPKL